MACSHRARKVESRAGLPPEFSSRLKLLQQPRVSRGKIVGGQFVMIDPFYCGAIERLGFALGQPAEEEIQQHRPLGVSVRDGLKQCSDNDFDAEFFPQFTDKALLEGFARFAFATGKFPQAAQMRIGVALRDEQLAGTEDQARADLNRGTRASNRSVRLSALSSRHFAPRPMLL